MRTKYRRLAVFLALASSAGVAPAATVLEYRHEGDCATDFDRMAIEGLHMRIDMRVEEFEMTSLIDDEEQLMHQVMHETRTYTTMESDDDAVDFNSDVARSTLLNARRQTQAATGMGHEDVMLQARAAQVAACPEMAGLGFGDPDYPEAASRCAEKMSATARSARPSREDVLALARGRASAGAGAAPARASEAPVSWNTTTLERETSVTRVDDRDCTVERIRRGAAVLREDCVAPVDSMALEPRAVRRLARLAKVGAGLAAGIDELHPELQSEKGSGPPTISLRRTCYRDGHAIGNATLRIRTEVAVDPGEFELPAGYAPLQVDMPSTDMPADVQELLDGLH
jgi:hypothetical protein